MPKSRALDLRAPSIVEVLWEDTATTGGWRERPEAARTSLVRSAGYLIRSDRLYVVVSQSNSSNGDWADTTVIPRSNVRCVRRLGRSKMRRED